MRKVSAKRMLFWYAFVMVGANMVHPFTPKMFTDLGLPDCMYGVAFACMSLMGLLSAPLWGKLGDKKGCVPMLAIGCLGYAAAQYLFYITTASVPIILVRLVAGVFAAPLNVSTLAYVVDNVPGESHSKYMAYYAAVMSVSSASGYLTGGILGDVSIGLGFAVQVIVMVVAAAGILLTLRDDPERLETAERFSWKEVNPFRAFADAKRVLNRRTGLFFLIIFIATFAFTALDNNFNYFIRAEWDFPTTYNGILKAVIGLLGLVANFTINLWIVRNVNQRKALLWVLGTTAVILAGIVLIDSVAVFLVLCVAGLILNAVHLPILQALSTRDRDNASSGVLAGLFNSFRSFGQMAGSLFAGFIYAYGGKLPFLSAGIACLIAAVFCWINVRQYQKLEE